MRIARFLLLVVRPADNRLYPANATERVVISRLIVVALLFFPLVTAGKAQTEPTPRSALRVERAAGGPVRVRWSQRTDGIAFLSVKGKRSIPILDGEKLRPVERARSFLDRHGRDLGLPLAAETVVRETQDTDEVGMDHVRMQQVHRGIPARFGELTVHLRGAGVVALHAVTFNDLDNIETTPRIPASTALDVARTIIQQEYGVTAMPRTQPHLEFFNPGILEYTAAATRLSWLVELRAAGLRARVWVDAESGEVLFHFNALPHGLERRIYDLRDTPEALPGTPVRFEGEPPTGDTDIDNVYDFTADTYEYYLREHGRDSYDDRGGVMTATVGYCDNDCGCPCLNAFWDNNQTSFGRGVTSDDVVGHEWTHGVTEYSSGLIYHKASGALNESYSDIFGETIDLTNTGGYDDPAVRWKFGETELFPAGLRNMKDPRMAIQRGPGKMSDRFFWCAETDNGGVHRNSGIGNHAYVLMVDGGTFNGFTIEGIGLNKAARVQYRALTRYLTSSSGFPDNYDALNQACADLADTTDITSQDCIEVRKALDAVEMYAEWPCRCGDGVVTEGEACDDGNKINGDGCENDCTLTLTPTPTATVAEATPTQTAAGTPTPTNEGTCIGDCDSSGTVTIDEIIRGINIALGTASLDLCEAFDRNADALVTIDEILAGVEASLSGCPADPLNATFASTAPNTGKAE